MYLGQALTIEQQRFNALYQLFGGKVVPFPRPAPSGSTIVTLPATQNVPISPPIRVVTEQPMPPATAPAVPVAGNAGTPVPAGFPTNQIFVAPDGSFWEYSSAQGAWMNVGTPYNTGAGATPPAPAPSPTGASTAPPTGTVAPGPVYVGAPVSSYQEILDWLGRDSLAASIGFAGIPNWIVGSGVAVIIYKVAQGARKGGR